MNNIVEKYQDFKRGILARDFEGSYILQSAEQVFGLLSRSFGEKAIGTEGRDILRVQLHREMPAQRETLFYRLRAVLPDLIGANFFFVNEDFLELNPKDLMRHCFYAFWTLIAHCNQAQENLVPTDPVLRRRFAYLLLTCRISGLDLSYQDLSGFDLDYWQLEEADLSQASLRGASMLGASFRKCHFYQADLSQANLLRAEFDTCRLSFSNLAESVFIEAAIHQGDLHQSYLDKADFSRAKMSAVNLAEASLVKTNFIEAELPKASLNKADLSRANLSKANLKGSNLQGAILREANLYHCNMQNTKVEGAYLRDMQNLMRADFRGVKLGIALYGYLKRQGAIVDEPAS